MKFFKRKKQKDLLKKKKRDEDSSRDAIEPRGGERWDLVNKTRQSQITNLYFIKQITTTN